MRWSTSILLLSITFAQPVFSQDKPVSDETRVRIAQAIKDLSSDVWKERQEAVEKLVKIGPAAIPALKEVAASATDTEVRTKAVAAIQQINAAAQIGASTITLSVKDAPAADVFAQLAKQANCEFATYPKNLWQQVGTRQITMDLKEVNFWVAFKEACEKAGVFPQQYGNERRMTLFQGANNSWNGPTITSGPFLVVANRIHRSNSVELSNPGSIQTDFNLTLTAFCEPKIRVVSSSYNVKVEEAVDEKGNSLASDTRMHDGMSSGNSWMWNLTARLNYPENAGKKIARIRGAARFVVQTQSETLDVPDILTVKNKEVTVAGRRMKIKECKKNGQQYEIHMTLFRDGMSQNDWNNISNTYQSIRLQDKDGRPLTSHGWGGGGGGTQMDYHWQFGQQHWNGEEGKIGEPFRLVWEIPTELRDMEVKFEFKDLPLP